MSFAPFRLEIPLNENQQPIIKAGKTFGRFLADIWTAVVQGSSDPIISPTVTASPYLFTASTKGTILISGGTVSAITISRDGSSYYPTGVTAGPISMSASDTVKLTYTVTPTVTFFPL